MSWKPPPKGAACWIQMFARDLGRAKTFYSTVFDWRFRESRHEGQGAEYAAMAHFQMPGDPGQTGGIFKAEGEEVLQTRGKGGVILYLYVENLYATMEEIVAAGGKSIAEPEKESAQGTLQLFEDTEGNCLGLYTWQSSTTNQSDSGN